MEIKKNKNKKKIKKTNYFLLVTLISILLSSIIVFSTATLYVQILKNGAVLTTINTGTTVTCNNYGETTTTTNWGSYNDCKTNGQGTYTYRGYIQGTLKCTQNYAPPRTVSGGNIIFCSAPDCSRTVSGFCDTTKPSTVTLTPNQGWYNGQITVTGNYTDNFKVYQTIYSYKTNDSSSYSSNSTSNCSSFGKNCSSTLTFNKIRKCNIQGYNTCILRAKALDYWNEESNYNYTNYSIDYIPPEEPIISIDDSNPYVYYNSTTNTLYYTNNTDVDGYPQGNFTITVTVKDNTSNTTEVSGIYSINFTDFFNTSSGQNYTYGNFRNNMNVTRTQMHTYIIGPNSNTEGTLTITITDSAGNIRTKNINILLDNKPPTNIPPITKLLQYEHQIVGYNYDTINFNLDYGSTTDTGIGLGHSNIYVTHANGTQNNIYKNPTCKNFEPNTFSSNNRIIENLPVTTTTTTYTDNSKDLLKNGYCQKFYIEVCDKVNNCAKITTINNQNIYGQDSTPGITKDAACTIFSTFDNCNNRAVYFNWTKAVLKEIPDCSGSCVGGIITYTDKNNNIQPSYNNKVEVLSKEEFYSYTNKNGVYRIYNITPAEYQLRAYPNETQILLGEKKTPVYDLKEEQNLMGDNIYKVIDNIDMLLGLDFSLCTNSCTLKTDPFGTCYSQCSDSKSYCAKDENGNIDSEKVAYLQACNGKKAGTRIINPNNPSEYIECCQGPIIPKANNKVKLKVNDADNVLKTERVVYYKGRLVRLVVAVFK